jgi:glyoxylase-like metal-dependent hydrolase (beta-lactamase superfamily II)
LSTTTVPELSFRLLSTGHCRAWGPLVFRGSPWKTLRFPATCALIEHPRGLVLFDTGYTARFFEATKTFPERFYRWATPVTLDERGSAAEQLRSEGIDVNDIGHVVVSHFHADHAGGLKDFPASRVVYDATGLEAFSRLGRFDAVRAAFLASLVPDLAGRSVALRRDDERWNEAGLHPAHWDLFGDGSLLVVPLPGHAPGQCGALFRSAQGWVFLIADAAWNLEELAGSRTLTALAAHIHDDWDEYLSTQATLRAWAAANPEAVIIPTHQAPDEVLS